MTLDDIPGVGSRMQERLKLAKIETVEALWNTQPKQLRYLWGNVTGERMWYALHGYDIQAAPTQRGMFGHGRVLPPGWRSIEKAQASSRMLLTKAARRMRRDRYNAGKLWLSLNLRDGAWSRERKLREVQDDHAILAALDLLWQRVRKELPPKIEIIQVGVTLGDLTPWGERQLDLFVDDAEERERCERITNTIDGLNRRFGQRVVTLGAWSPPPGDYVGGKIAFNRIPSAEDFW